MNEYYEIGKKLREVAKSTVMEYMNSNAESARSSYGITQAQIFRDCGLDWGNKPNTTSSQQQYWIVALLRELEQEGKVIRNPDNKKWKIK